MAVLNRTHASAMVGDSK